LSLQQACAEANDLLERHYVGMEVRSYETALRDAKNGKQYGYKLICSWLILTIKADHRKKYTQWIFACLIQQFQATLPNTVQEFEPAQLVNFIPELILNPFHTETLVQQLSTNLKKMQ